MNAAVINPLVMGERPFEDDFQFTGGAYGVELLNSDRNEQKSNFSWGDAAEWLNPIKPIQVVYGAATGGGKGQSAPNPINLPPSGGVPDSTPYYNQPSDVNAGNGNKAGSSTGKIILWSGVGIVSLSLIGFAIYLATRKK
jgi:hypothetical protein